MHMGPQDAGAFCDEFARIISPDRQKEWVIFPPAVSLETLRSKFKGGFVKWGAQNFYFEEKGAFTGEISPLMLKELGCAYALVGHSERRQLFGETDGGCSKKIKVAHAHGIIPMYCVGETQKERDAAATDKVLETQLKLGLADWEEGLPLVIAYEPVWAIGTGKVATPAMAEEAHRTIRKILGGVCKNSQLAAEVPILYGGSVKPDNSRELIALPNIDGFLVGGASLQPKSFAQIGQMPV